MGAKIKCFCLFASVVCLVNSSQFEIGITFGKNITVENIFAYALQSSKCSKEISSYFGNVFVDTCRIHNLPITYDDGLKASADFSIEDEIKEFSNEKKALTKNDIDWSITYFMRNKENPRKKEELEEILFKKLKDYYKSNEKDLYNLLKTLHIKQCNETLKWMNDSNDKLKSIFLSKNVNDLISVYSNSSSDNSRFSATFTPKKCIVRLNKCGILYKPLYHPFRSSVAKLTEIQSIEAFDVFGILNVKEDTFYNIPASASYCNNVQQKDMFSPQLFLINQ